MIPIKSIIEWQERGPWIKALRAEQDLVLSRILIELYSDPLIKRKLVLRGGSSLYKLFINFPVRYSETVELVQIEPGAIGPYVHAIRKKLDPWLGEPSWKIKTGGITSYYRFTPESSPNSEMQIKIKVSTQEYFSHFDPINIEYGMKNSWFSGSSRIKTYCLEELSGAKLRALYYRNKGRDLFDLFVIKDSFPHLVLEKVIKSFPRFMNRNSLPILREDFEENLLRKLEDPSFEGDIERLLPEQLHSNFDFKESAEMVFRDFISKLPTKTHRQMAL
jgi:predicted nucleotidyltransferase component of viral defense system